jgi:hypothetical protein
MSWLIAARAVRGVKSSGSGLPLPMSSPLLTPPPVSIYDPIHDRESSLTLPQSLPDPTPSSSLTLSLSLSLTIPCPAPVPLIPSHLLEGLLGSLKVLLADLQLVHLRGHSCRGFDPLRPLDRCCSFILLRVLTSI